MQTCLQTPLLLLACLDILGCLLGETSQQHLLAREKIAVLALECYLHFETTCNHLYPGSPASKNPFRASPAPVPGFDMPEDREPIPLKS